VIRQDADIYRVRPVTGSESVHVLRPGRGLWLQVIRGPIWLDGVELSDGDGASVEEAGEHRIGGESGTEGLLFDLR
jgi:redox-sensitive bicupin YhaK (pirin superfamily)